MNQEKCLKVFKMRSDNFDELNGKIKEYSSQIIDSVTILRLEDTSYFLTIHYYGKKISTFGLHENKNENYQKFSEPYNIGAFELQSKNFDDMINGKHDPFNDIFRK